MTEASEVDRAWSRFVRSIAEISQMEPGDIKPEARLIEDLALDSVALAELLTILIDDYGVERLVTGLEDQGWAGLTAKELFDRFVNGDPGRPRLVVKREWR